MTDKGINIPKMKEMIDESFSDKKMREDLHEHVVDCEKFAVRIIYHLKSFITFFFITNLIISIKSNSKQCHPVWFREGNHLCSKKLFQNMSFVWEHTSIASG